jgi:hypothetical protein
MAVSCRLTAIAVRCATIFLSVCTGQRHGIGTGTVQRIARELGSKDGDAILLVAELFMCSALRSVTIRKLGSQAK